MSTASTPLRLLMVEGSAADAAQVILALEPAGYSIVAHRVETEAALRAALFAENWDILICDHAPPPLSAPVAVAIAQAMTPSVPVVIVSNTIGPSQAVELMRSGAHDYIRKDDLATLPLAVGRELRAAAAERERQRVEAALLDSEVRWQFALEDHGEGVWDWNYQTGRGYLSRQWKAMLGYTEDEIDNSITTWRALIHPDDLGRVYTAGQALREGRSPIWNCEYRLRCRDGRYKWVQDRGKVISYTGDGKPLRVIGTQIDITERKQQEAELQRLKEFNEGIVQGLREGLTLHDAKGRYTFANPAAHRILGRPPETLLGQPWTVIFPPDLEARARQLFENQPAGQPGLYEMEVLQPGGQRVPILWRSTPRFENGQYTGALSLFTDLSERDQARRAMQTSQTMLQNIFSQAPWGMCQFKLQSEGNLVIVDVNQAAETLLRQPWAELIGQTLEQVFPAIAATEFPGRYRDAATRGRLWRTEQLSFSEGRIASAFSLLAFQIAPDHAVVAFDDILERKQAEETIQNLADTLRNQNRALEMQNRELLTQSQQLRRAEANLRTSDERYRALIETADTGYVLLDAAGRVQDANEEYVRLTGRPSLADVLGHAVTEWTAPRDQARNAEAIRACLEDGFIRSLEVDYTHPADTITRVELNATALATADGDLIVGLCREITRRPPLPAEPPADPTPGPLESPGHTPEGDPNATR